MNEHPVEGRLSGYLDGELSATESEGVRAHLEACPSCRELLDELRRVAEAARDLEDRPPPRDLWPDIEARIRRSPRPGPRAVRRGAGRGRSGRGRRVSLTIPQLAAAALLLVGLSAGLTRAVLAPGSGPGAQNVAPAGGGAPAAGPAATPAGAPYRVAARDLERGFESSRREIGGTRARRLESDVALLNRAIGESRTALDADPDNPYLHRHLAESLRRKAELVALADGLVPGGGQP